MSKEAQALRDKIDAATPRKDGIAEGMAFLQLAFERLAGTTPAKKVAAADRTAMKKQYDGMTDTGIDALAMEGDAATQIAAFVASRLGMLLDHQSALLAPYKASLADQGKGDVISSFGKSIDAACDKALADGLTPEGVVSVLCVSSMPVRALGKQPIAPIYAMRWMLHGIEQMQPKTRTQPKTDKDIAEILAKEMGVSVSTAMKYVKQGKQRQAVEAGTGFAPSTGPRTRTLKRDD